MQKGGASFLGDIIAMECTAQRHFVVWRKSACFLMHKSLLGFIRHDIYSNSSIDCNLTNILECLKYYFLAKYYTISNILITFVVNLVNVVNNKYII